jgi:hypothetical protein
VETTRRYAVVVEPDEDGVSIATVPASPGVVEHGGTERYAVLQSRARVYPGLSAIAERPGNTTESRHAVRPKTTWAPLELDREPAYPVPCRSNERRVASPRHSAFTELANSSTMVNN